MPPAATIPRLSLDDMPSELQDALAPRVARLGYLGEFFSCMAHQPDALAAFVDLTAASKAPLDDRTVELIALTVATRMGNHYERNQHERLSVRLGLGREWVAQVERLRWQELDDPPSRAVQRFVLETLDGDARQAHSQLAPVVEALGPGAISVLFVTGRYLMHSFIVGALDLDPPVPSIFDEAVGSDG